jgi:hypothetical protein
MYCEIFMQIRRFSAIFGKKPSIYYVSKRTGWVGSKKKGGGEFADVQYCIYADIVGGSEKVQKYFDVIYGWSPRIQL